MWSYYLLNDFLSKYNLLDDPDWEPYSKYKGIKPTDSLDKIKHFLKTKMNGFVECVLQIQIKNNQKKFLKDTNTELI